MPTEETIDAHSAPGRLDRQAQMAVDLGATPPPQVSELSDEVAPIETRAVGAEERLAAIAEAHANGDNYYDGTTTIDGREVEVWLTPDGATVYFDRDAQSVVDMTWLDDADRDAAMAAAHEAGDAFYAGHAEVGGVDAQMWIAPGGMEVYTDATTGEVVAVRWPDGQAPVYQGQVSYGGESMAVFEFPNGQYGLVRDGETVLLFDDWDDVDVDPTTHPVFGEVYGVPLGPPSYDTAYFDADTGDPLYGESSGTVMLDGALTHYIPPGEDYGLVIDQFGNILGSFELPPDEDWTFLGITRYEDGSITVDLGAGEVHVDLDAEGGIWFSSDGLGELIEGADWVGSVSAGVEWDESGVEVHAAAEVAGVGDFGYEIEVGEDGFDVAVDAEVGVDIGGRTVGVAASGEFGYADGALYAGGDVDVSMSIGLLDITASSSFYVEVGDEGFEAEYAWDGRVGMLGGYVSGGEAFSLDVDGDGVTATYSTYRGIGHEALGETRLGAEAQVNTDGTLAGSSATAGVYGSTNDREGEEVDVVGGYVTADGSGRLDADVRDERLDTGVTVEDYDRHAGRPDDVPPSPDGSADIAMDLPGFEPGSDVVARDMSGTAPAGWGVASSAEPAPTPAPTPKDSRDLTPLDAPEIVTERRFEIDAGADGVPDRGDGRSQIRADDDLGDVAVEFGIDDITAMPVSPSPASETNASMDGPGARPLVEATPDAVGSMPSAVSHQTPDLTPPGLASPGLASPGPSSAPDPLAPDVFGAAHDDTTGDDWSDDRTRDHLPDLDDDLPHLPDLDDDLGPMHGLG